MGFKRTSDGRIFFQNQGEEMTQSSEKQKKTSNGAANNDDYDFERPLILDRPMTGAKKAPAKQQGNAQAVNPQTTQMQIVALLKTLNERLKVTQAERNKMATELETTRAMVEALQEQGGVSTGGNAHAESMAREALKEVEEARHLLAQLETTATRADTGVATLKKLQAEQAEKMAISVNHSAALTKRLKDAEEWQEQNNARIEDALSGQARLNRRIDKAIEERTRFMRKLERIEETVLETREAMNAKAMVLLTDQGVAGEQDAPSEYVPGAHAHPHAEPKLNENQNRVLQITGVGLLLTAALLGGYLINAYQNKSAEQADLTAAYQAQIQQSQSAVQPEEPVFNTFESNAAPTDMAAMDWSVENNTSDFTTSVDPAADDIGTLNLNDQAQIEAMLDGNPDAVANALNGVEPGNALPDNIVVTEADPQEAAPQEAAVEPAAGEDEAPAQAEAPPEPAAPKPITVNDPKSVMKPDASLPEVVKNIETQAFEGVPEAQHDLAAIYTAGHGGVKQDYNRAAFWFEQAAARGVANAAYNLGVLNHQGLGVDADLRTAINWYTRAAELGHPEAQYNLGIAYIEGIGVPYDAQKAAVYFENAAKNNITEAAYNLGLIYENGLLGEAAPDQALVWYKTAADKGSPEAKEALEQLAKSLGVSVKDVNSLADSMKDKEASNATKIEPAAGTSEQAAPVTTAAVEPANENVLSVSSSAPLNPISPPNSPASQQQIVTAQVQEYLMRMGLYPGPADGVTGPLTEDAVRSYQRLHNLNPDGQIGDNLLSHMLANDAGSNLNQ